MLQSQMRHHCLGNARHLAPQVANQTCVKHIKWGVVSPV